MEVIKFLQQFSNPALDSFFILITMLGEDTFFILAITLIFWCIDKKLAYRLGFAYLLNGVVNSSIKHLVQAPRPIGQQGIFSLRTETATGSSFPSGHTESAASFWTSIMAEAREKWVYVLGTVMILMVAISRLYLGVHWPQDVLAGAVFGFIVVLISNRLFNNLDKSRNKPLVLFIIVPVGIGMLLFDSQDYYKAAGAVCSFALGYVLDDLYIRYESGAGLYQQIIKFVTGISVLICIKSGLKAFFPDMLIYHFVRYLLIGAWVTIFSPLFFKHILKIRTLEKK